jgi:YVTN family beta-propeller protein
MNRMTEGWPKIERLACRSLMARFILTASVAGIPFADSPAATARDLPFQPVADIPLGGNATRLDYESFDSSRHLLFIAHLGDSAVIVFDTQTQRVVTRIADVSKVHGVLAVPELGTVYASATGTNEVVAIDATSLKITARMPGGVYPDGMAYAPSVHKLYVSDEHGGTDTVIDVKTNTRVTTIALGGEVGNTQYDPVSRHIFSNVQTRNQLLEIDPATDTVIERIDLPGAQGNHGLLIESGQHRAFIACEGNDKLLVLDLQTKKVTASFDVGKDPDVLAFDPGLHYLYVAGEAGVASIFKVEAGNVSKIGDGFVGPNAHVVAVDPSTHQTYFPLMNLHGRTVLRIMRPTS